MDTRKRRALQELGGRTSTVAEFLGLSAIEETIVEMRLALAEALRMQRQAAKMTQAEVAKAIGSTQSRVAKMEGGDPQSSIESLLRAVVAVGGRPTLTVKRAAPRLPRSRSAASGSAHL